MATSKTDILEWIIRGQQQDKDYLIVVCDTFSYEDFPVFCSREKVKEKYREYSCSAKNMSKVMEVYNLKEDIGTQISQPRCLNLPED